MRTLEVIAWDLAVRDGMLAKAAEEARAAEEAAEEARAAQARSAPPVASRPAPSASTGGGGGAGGVLARIRQCESGGNYAIDTGNGFYGAYQFTLSTWRAMGGTGNPAHASPQEQDERAGALYAQAGNAPWPNC